MSNFIILILPNGYTFYSRILMLLIRWFIKPTASYVFGKSFTYFFMSKYFQWKVSFIMHGSAGTNVKLRTCLIKNTRLNRFYCSLTYQAPNAKPYFLSYLYLCNTTQSVIKTTRIRYSRWRKGKVWQCNKLK